MRPTLIYNPCTEDVLSLDGTVRQIVSLTESKGHFRTNTSISYSGVSAVGVLSGMSYRIHGNSRTGTGLHLNFNGFWPREVYGVSGQPDPRLPLTENDHSL